VSALSLHIESTDSMIHYLHVAAAELYSLPALTAVGLSVGLHRDYISEGIFQPLEVDMSLQTQSLRLAGERAGRWNEVGEWGDMCYNY